MFTWDINKALINYEKHGVSFEEAISVFNDATALVGDDIKHSIQEPRFFRVGAAQSGKLLTVIFTVRRLVSGKETIRIISARKASRKERKAYEGRGY